MKDKGIFGVGRKEFKQEFVLTDYSVKIQNTPIPNYLILGFDANESARESFNKCIDKWISDGFTNAEIIYLLLNLVRIARENTFISSIDDDEYKFICEKYDNNIDPFFNAIANIIEKSDNKIIHDDNLLVSTFNIFNIAITFTAEQYPTNPINIVNAFISITPIFYYYIYPIYQL